MQDSRVCVVCNSRKLMSSKQSQGEFDFYQTNNIVPTTPTICSFPFFFLPSRPTCCFSPEQSSSIHPHYLNHTGQCPHTVWESNPTPPPPSPPNLPLVSARCPCWAWFMSLWRSWAVAACGESQQLVEFPWATKGSPSVNFGHHMCLWFSKTLLCICQKTCAFGELNWKSEGAQKNSWLILQKKNKILIYYSSHSSKYKWCLATDVLLFFFFTRNTLPLAKSPIAQHYARTSKIWSKKQPYQNKELESY